jgi:citrate synthase
MADTQKATLSFSDGTPSIDFPIHKGSVGPDVIDIRKLYGQTGKFTFDPGFMSTAACDSKITYIDGDKGELQYRGYPTVSYPTARKKPTSSTALLTTRWCMSR